MTRPKVHVLTNIPSYHQVDLFDAVAERGDVDIFVTYLRGESPGRLWSKLPTPRHANRALRPLFAKQPFYFNPGLLRHLTEVAGDLLVVTQYSALAYQQAMVWAAAAGRPFVFWSERPGVQYFEVPSLLPPVARSALRSLALLPVKLWAREVWAIGPPAREFFCSTMGCPVRTLPYFSRLEPFRRAGRSLAPGGRVRFLFAGRLSYRKGYDVVAGAFEALEADDRFTGRWSLTVCGDGELRDLGRRIRGADHLGFKELAAMPAVMMEHDVFLAPSRYDGWGMVVPEALAAGMTVITTRQAGAAQDIGPARPLRFVEAGDARALLAALAEILERPEVLQDDAAGAEAIAFRYDAEPGARTFSRLARAALEEGASSC